MTFSRHGFVSGALATPFTAALPCAARKRLVETGIHAPTGNVFLPCGYRSNVKGMIKSPVQFFWNMPA